MTIWLVSDRHINHAKLRELPGRSEDFDSNFVNACLYEIGKSDTVIDLGDVIFGKNSTLSDWQRILPGHWILVRGNHDSHSSWFEKKGFVLAVESFVREWHGLMILFSHEPVVPLPFGIDYNVHGHFHNSTHRVEEYANSQDYLDNQDKYLLVEIETTCRPVTLDAFLSARTGR